MPRLKSYPVWDAAIRWFHWINFACVLVLSALGLVLLKARALGIDEHGRLLVRTLHVNVGCLFALNLAWRLVWAFIGGPYSRWRELLPGGRGYRAALRRYLSALRKGRQPQYLGHNPLGRAAVSLLLLSMLVQAITGLALAGTSLDRALLSGMHAVSFYALSVLAILHIGAVVLTEVRGGGNLISAMFTGRKILRAPMAQRADAPCARTGSSS
jgi:cytochrome b